MSVRSDYDLVIIGAGPAGLAAAIEASRHDLSTLFLMISQPRVVRYIGTSRRTEDSVMQALSLGKITGLEAGLLMVSRVCPQTC